jgi:hypothetical protein
MEPLITFAQYNRTRVVILVETIKTKNMKNLILILVLTLTGSVFGQVKGLEYYKEVKPSKKTKLFARTMVENEKGMMFWYESDDSAAGLQTLLNEVFLLSVENNLEYPDITLYEAKQATTDSDLEIYLEYDFDNGSYIVLSISPEEAILGGLCKTCE